MIPVIFYLYSQGAEVRIHSRRSIATDDIPGLIRRAVTDALRQWSGEGGEELYFYLLDSYAFQADIRRRVLEEYPNLPADSVTTVVRRDISYKRKTRTTSFLNSVCIRSPEVRQLLVRRGCPKLEELSIKLRKAIRRWSRNSSMSSSIC